MGQKTLCFFSRTPTNQDYSNKPPYSDSGDGMDTKQTVSSPEHLFKESMEGGKSTQGLQGTIRSGTQKMQTMNNLELLLRH